LSNYQLTPDAQADLIEIRRFTTKKWSEAQSKKYLAELRQSIQKLAQSPSLGKFRPDVGTNVLCFAHMSHVIYCIALKQQIVVFGVLHKRMAPLNHLVQRKIIK